MSQSTLIVGGILVAFLAWVTLNGRLPLYLADLGLGRGGSGASAGGVINQTGGSGGFLGGNFFPLGSGSAGGFSQLPSQISGFIGGVSF